MTGDDEANTKFYGNPKSEKNCDKETRTRTSVAARCPPNSHPSIAAMAIYVSLCHRPQVNDAGGALSKRAAATSKIQNVQMGNKLMYSYIINNQTLSTTKTNHRCTYKFWTATMKHLTACTLQDRNQQALSEIEMAPQHQQGICDRHNASNSREDVAKSLHSGQ
jgi:hypothetical protein